MTFDSPLAPLRVVPAAGSPGCGHVAIISRKSLAAHRYDLWLGDLGLTSALYVEGTPRDLDFLSTTPDHRYDICRVVGDLATPDLIDALLSDHGERPFTAIVALHEDDIVVAGDLRLRLGLPGQHLASAIAYRDKLAMKRHLAGSGVACPRFAPVDSRADLVAFAAGAEGPVVLKPRRGSGATGVHRLTADDCERHDAAEGWDDLIAEDWIEGPMVSVDGLMAAGRVVALMVGRYTDTCLASLGSLAPHGILQVDDDDPVFAAASAATTATIAALPTAPELRPFHAEFFETPDGLVFCEIAARTGGGNLYLIMRNALGIDPEYAACLGQAGINLALPDEPRTPDATRVFGDMVIPRSQAALIRPQRDHALSGVLSATFRDMRGSTSAANAVSDIEFDALLGAEDHRQLRHLYDDLVDWVAQAQSAPT